MSLFYTFFDCLNSTILLTTGIEVAGIRAHFLSSLFYWYVFRFLHFFFFYCRRSDGLNFTLLSILVTFQNLNEIDACEKYFLFSCFFFFFFYFSSFIWRLTIETIWTKWKMCLSVWKQVNERRNKKESGKRKSF